MTILVSIFGVAGRLAGDLLTTALGWASSLLFGRVPRSHKIFLVLMMAWSFLWVLAVLALVVPTIVSVMLATTPHPPFMDRAWLAFALLLCAIVAPLGVGLAGYFVPATSDRPSGLSAPREILRGYLLAPLISGLLVFLAIVGVARKVRSKRHGWADDHVPIVVKPNGYDQLVADLRSALVSAGLPVLTEDAPWVLTMPAWLISRVAGPNVRKLRPDRLRNLVMPDLRIGVYPSDVAISGPTHDRTRARAAIMSRFATTAAHLTTSAEAQELEDDIEQLAKSGSASGRRSAESVRARLGPIDEQLLALAIPTDEWDILYRLRVQVERDLLAGDTPDMRSPVDGSRPPEIAAPRSSIPTGRAPAAPSGQPEGVGA